MAYPDDIYVQRDLENLPGLEFDPSNKKTLFAEDILALGAEVNAIETVLGTDFEPGRGSELPMGSIYTTTIDLENEPPFEYGTWDLIASGNFYGTKTTYTYERTA